MRAAAKELRPAVPDAVQRETQWSGALLIRDRHRPWTREQARFAGARVYPTAAASAGFAAAAGEGESEAMSARLMVACRVGEVIFAPNRSVT